jgi:DNA repair exonuclease SbcCD ATPase subunit
MTSEINQLLEESVTRSAELGDTADEAMTAIDGMVKNAEALTERVREEGSETGRHLHEIAARLEQAGGELEVTRGNADGALDGLAGKAADLKAEIGNLLERVKRNMGELEAQQNRMNESLDGHASSTEAAFKELAEKTHELEAETGRHLEQAGAAISAFRSAVDAARAEFAHQREAWDNALASLETHAHEQADAWTAGLHGLLTRQATTMVETANAMVDHHNGAMDHLRQRFVEQAPHELDSAIEPLRTAIEHLRENAATRQQGFSSHVQELGQSEAEALSVIDGIGAGLTSAARLG